jgi:heme/copper-type cytochrome/quinol oxidase subunit 2
MYASSPIPSMKGNPPVPSYADENAETRWLTALVVTITIVITVIVILFVAVAVAIRRNENVASV